MRLKGKYHLGRLNNVNVNRLTGENIKLNSHTAANRKKMMNPGKDRGKEDFIVY